MKAHELRSKSRQDLLKDLDELRTHWQQDRRFEPVMSAEEREQRYRQWQKAVSKSLDWVDDDARTLMGTAGR